MQDCAGPCRSHQLLLLIVLLLVQVLSSGDARIAAKGGHTGASSTVYHNQPGFGSTLYNDPDLQTIGADGSGRNMCVAWAAAHQKPETHQYSSLLMIPVPLSVHGLHILHCGTCQPLPESQQDPCCACFARRYDGLILKFDVKPQLSGPVAFT